MFVRICDKCHVIDIHIHTNALCVKRWNKLNFHFYPKTQLSYFFGILSKFLDPCKKNFFKSFAYKDFMPLQTQKSEKIFFRNFDFKTQIWRLISFKTVFGYFYHKS